MRFYIFFILSLGLATAAVETTPETAQLRFRTLACFGTVAPEIYYQNKPNQYQLIVSETNGRSPFYNLYAVRDSITFYTKTKDPQTGKDRFVPATSIDIKGKGLTPLLLFFASRDQPSGFSILALADDPEKLPPGHFQYVNLTTRAIRLLLNQEKVTINAGESLIAPPPSGGSTVNVAMAVYNEDSPVLLYSNIWPKQIQLRNLVLIYLSSETASGFSVKRLTDYPIAWKPQPAAGKPVGQGL